VDAIATVLKTGDGFDWRGRFGADPETSYVLPARHYWDPGIYQREMGAIFHRTWQMAGHLSRLREPGDYFTFTVGDQNLFAVRGKDGEVRAFYNVCSHRAHELLKGEGRSRVITCPYHAWSFHADGKLRTARGSEKVAGFDKDEFCLKQVRTETFCGFLFANLDPDAPTLASLTGNLENEIRSYCPDIDKLVRARRLHYELKANWKNVVDNFLECYHCPPAHPAFTDLVAIPTYRTKTYGCYSSHISEPHTGRSKAYSFDASDPNVRTEFAAWWLWPNVAFNVFPGCANIAVLHIMPDGPERSREHFDFYFLDEQATAEQEEAIRYTDEILQAEDIGLVESVQRGLKSRGYHQGRYVVDKERTDISEHGLHHFHGLVLQALEART